MSAYREAILYVLAEHPNLYQRPLTLHRSPEGVADDYVAKAMVKGGLRLNVDLSGKMIQRACKSLSINCTYTAIESFLLGKVSLTRKGTFLKTSTLNKKGLK